MAKPNLIVLYVADPQASVDFYRKLLGKEPIVAFPTFSSFELQQDFVLGLWAKAGVQPEPVGDGSRAELAFMVEGEEAVRAHYDEWRAMGLPDGHRLRVCLYDE